MKKARYIKVLTSQNEVAEGLVINKNIYSDNIIDYKLLGKDFSRKWAECNNVPDDILEDKMVNVPAWLVKMSKDLPSWEKLEYQS